MSDVISAQHEGALRLRLGFEDGTEGVVDLGSELVGQLAVLRDDADRFAAAYVDGGTVRWPGGLSMASSRLYALVHSLPIPQAFEGEPAQERVATLGELRELVGITQVELAMTMGITQAELATLEQRPDMQLDDLRRYVEALGGELEVVAVFGDKRVRIA